MIKLTRLNGEVIFINYHLIEKIDVIPNTIITMNSQIQYLVKESVEDINQLIIEFNRKIFRTE